MIISLRPKERVVQDGEAIAAIYRNLGTGPAEEMVSRALAELALAVARLAAQVKAHDLRDLPRQLTKLQRMAENLGMLSLALIAQDACQSLAQEDDTAFSAIWARLLRAVERSLAPNCGFVDLSG